MSTTDSNTYVRFTRTYERCGHQTECTARTDDVARLTATVADFCPPCRPMVTYRSAYGSGTNRSAWKVAR